MKSNVSPHPLRFIGASLILILLIQACGGPAEVIPPTPTATAIPEKPTAQPTNTPLPTPKPIPTVSELSKATVQIFAMFDDEVGWTGSGTIISPNGMIVTNAHVASNHAPGLALLYQDINMVLTPEPDALVIALVEDESLPPTETYIAEVVSADGALDLALLQIVSDLDGNPVDKETLELPYVELGDSNEVRLGDSIRIFGFPGFGGETITFTEGTVSGFESQDGVGDRAWIKTDSSIAPGNSGGLAVNEAGQIVGIPTWGIEGSDIGRLRSVNFAKELVEAGRNYRSQYVEEGTGKEAFELVTWAEDSDEQGCPIGALETYKSGALAVVSVWGYEQMADGEDFLLLYFHNNELVANNLWAWEDGQKAECFAISLHNYGKPLPNGDYRFELYAGKGYPLIGSATTTIGSVQTGDIKMKGRVIDYFTGKGIPDATFILLNPGVDTEKWLDNPTDTDIYSVATTDSSGRYTLPDPLERGVEYPAVVFADGYYIAWGPIMFGSTDPTQVTFDVSLEPLPQ